MATKIIFPEFALCHPIRCDWIFGFCILHMCHAFTSIEVKTFVCRLFFICCLVNAFFSWSCTTKYGVLQSFASWKLHIYTHTYVVLWHFMTWHTSGGAESAFGGTVYEKRDPALRHAAYLDWWVSTCCLSLDNINEFINVWLKKHGAIISLLSIYVETTVYSSWRGDLQQCLCGL